MLETKIQELLESASVSYKNFRRSFVLSCPICNKHDKLWILKSTGQFVCWTCQDSGFKGRPEFALSKVVNKSIQDIRTFLYGKSVWKTGVILSCKWEDWFDADEEEIKIVEPPLLPTVYPPDVVDITDHLAMPGVQYLLNRGIPPNIAKKYQIKYNVRQSRVVFPVISNGELYGWQGRSILPEKTYLEDGTVIKNIKALTSADLKKQKILMFADRLKNSEHAVLCEGPVDAIKCDLVGGNVCTLGKQVSDYQLNLLVNSGIKKLYLGLDPDAYKSAKEVVKKIGDLVEIYDLRPPSKYSDLGEMSFEEVKNLFDNAPRLEPWQLLVYFNNEYRPS